MCPCDLEQCIQMFHYSNGRPDDGVLQLTWGGLQEVASNLQLVLLNDVAMAGRSRRAIMKAAAAYAETFEPPCTDRSVARVGPSFPPSAACLPGLPGCRNGCPGMPATDSHPQLKRHFFPVKSPLHPGVVHAYALLLGPHQPCQKILEQHSLKTGDKSLP